MVSMRLMRFGAKKRPSYRIVVMDSRRARQSQVLDTIGTYQPLDNPAGVRIDLDKARAWLGKGAKPSETVRSLLKKAEAPTPTREEQT